MIAHLPVRTTRRRWQIIAVALAAALCVAVVPGQLAAAAPADGTVRTFDDETVGAPPADCDIVGDVTVADAGFGGAPATNSAMHLVDQSNTVYTRAWCHYPQTTERSVSYRFSPAQINAGPYVAIQGAPGTSANGVWRFTFNRDGDDIRIAAYNGSSFADVARITGGAALGEWVDVTINATLDRAELIVNGVRFQTDRRNAASPTMGDIYFGSAGASAVGVDYYIDDLTVTEQLPDNAFAGVTIEPVFDDTGAVKGTEIVDAPIARFLLPDGAAVADYSATAQWRDQSIPAVLSGPDTDGWVTVSITHTFSQAGASSLRTVVTDADGVQSVSTQQITVAGAFSELTFESDPVGSIPPDCSTLEGYIPAAVSDESSYEGEHSLRVHDTSATASAGMTCTVLAQQGAYLSFQVNPRSLQDFTVDLIGRSLIPTGQPANSLFRLALRADGAVQWYEQWTATWRELSPAGSVPLDRWTRMELAVPADNAAVRVSVDGAYVGSAGPTIGNNSSKHNEVTGITGLAFTTTGSGAAAVQDDVFVDDIIFGSPASTPPAAVGTAPFHIGDTVAIDGSGEQVGFPNPGVVVSNGDGRKRVLIPYSGHPDVDDAGGIFLGASDDGGASWFNGQEMNPMPDTSGVTMTRLRNGDLLAVNFHAYMMADTDDRQALVETAVSGDSGASWTHREGVMTSPEPMRPIGASERPGTTLGGFVLLHTVVEDPDGTLYMSAYGYYAADENFRQIVLVSRNGGVDWSVAGTVAVADPAQSDVVAYEGPCEGAIERLADGSLIMVMRVGWRLPMIYSRSTDNGATWSEPQQIEVGPAGQDLLSVQPTLELLPTGELLLMVGRPGLVMTISESGLGDDWSVPVGIDYVNTENGSFTVLDPTTVIAAGDRGRAAPWEVWSRQVTIDPPCEQTITGSHDGRLTAGAGGLCLIDATVSGSVSVEGGGRLIIQDSDITGPVTATGASVIAICGSRIEGQVTLSDTTGGVAVGDTTAGCDPSTVIGPLRVTETSGPVVVDRSEVTGAVTISGSGSSLATVLSGLTVNGSLTCTQNALEPTDAGVELVVSGARKGQCAG
ncbi:sialidase family protein [Microbacterium sp. TWP3-1-2b2]|uniref:sialidase family protein n=1 Tax=Microbacterium sp. TWP3-1-2b2 TaxID=2804651 RepID=UPI003CF409D3